MNLSRVRGAVAPVVSLLALFALSPANAVPCGTYATVGGIKIGSTDLGTSSSTCRNGPSGDATDSVDDLNGGAFFGSTDWTLLTKTADGQGGNSSFWTFNNLPNGSISGTFSLTDGLWDLYSKLVVVLKDGGSTTNRDIKWSAYLLPQDIYGTYSWSYDNRKQLSHMTLYGIKGGTTSVPEPATLALFGLGLAGATVALRRKRALAR
jgi:hypothetical protein